MRYLSFLIATCLFFSSPVSANWQKINDVDYVWGPFTIYNISLFSETGEYKKGTRPLMLSLKYMKPVDGRDFAISLARSWSNLGITLPEQEKVVDRLRKMMPNIKKGDVLSYIALEDKGYFVLNKTVIGAEFNQDFNNAVVAVWLDDRVEIGRALLSKQHKIVETVKPTVQQTTQPEDVVKNTEETAKADTAENGKSAESSQVDSSLAADPSSAAESQGVTSSEKSAKPSDNEPTSQPVLESSAQNAEQKPAETKPAETNEQKGKLQEEEVEIWDAVDPVFLNGEVIV